jgi:hypothetical protein
VFIRVNPWLPLLFLSEERRYRFGADTNGNRAETAGLHRQVHRIPLAPSVLFSY